MLCQWSTIVIVDDIGVNVHTFSCKCWHCEGCFYKRLLQLQHLAKEGKPNSFLTLTSEYREDISPDEAARNLVVAFRNLRQRARRDGIAKRFEFIAVFEETDNGWPHLHILFRGPYIPQDWISDRMREYIDSPIVWISSIENLNHAAWYIAKYISKGPAKFDGCKRYWTSRGYALGPVEESPVSTIGNRTVTLLDKPLNEVCRQLVNRGWMLSETTEYKARFMPNYNPRLPDWLASNGHWQHGPPDFETMFRTKQK